MQGLSHENHKAKQSQQAGSGPSDGKQTPLPLCFQAKMGADFFKSDLDVPAADIPGHDLEHGNGGVWTEEGKWGAFATGITQEDPADGQWVFSITMPSGTARDHIHPQLLSGVPGDFLTEPNSRSGFHALSQLRLAGTFFGLDSRLAFRLRWNGIVELCIQEQARDKADSQAAARTTQAGRGKTTIAYQHDLSLRKPASHEPDQELSSLCRRAMAFARFGASGRSQGGNTDDR